MIFRRRNLGQHRVALRLALGTATVEDEAPVRTEVVLRASTPRRG